MIQKNHDLFYSLWWVNTPQLAAYMRLMPAECSRLMEAYQITAMGYSTYYRRKSVQVFLASFPSDAIRARERQIWQEQVVVNEQEFITPVV